VALAFTWPQIHLSDVNPELIATYRAVARFPDRVKTALAGLSIDPETYDSVRLSRPTRDVTRAARLLYLNRCGYGGIYRTNRDGVYNVPFSGDRSTRSLIEGPAIDRAAQALRGASIRTCGFRAAVKDVGPGDFVYCDPAYVLPDSGERAFQRYNATVFTWADQKRLADSCAHLASSGAIVLVSNSADPRVAALHDGALALEVSRRITFPKANGASAREALYLHGDTRVKSLASQYLNQLIS
jgi:DNA adenine methylase